MKCGRSGYEITGFPDQRFREKKGLLEWGGAQSRRLIKPGLGLSYFRIFVSKWQRS